ncbi:MAG: hypothetical protein G01um101419_541 [Parcubacteria group bacterium Gr01-1014_19]|nr:MAG: hypothetical protein G01um101419_541 [Parcubacteria group bacterium Gr01-1014_19]
MLVAGVAQAVTYVDADSVGIATSSPGAALGVKGAGIFEGFVSADYFVSTSTHASWVSGNFHIATITPYDTAAEFTVQGDAHISRHAAIGPQAAIDGNSVVCPDCGYTYSTILTNREIVTDMTTAVFVEGISNEMVLNPSSVPTSIAWGIDNEVFIKSGNTRNFTSLGGDFTGVTHEGSGNVTNSVRGVVAYMENAGSGTIARLTGFDASMINRTGGGAVTLMRGVNINIPQNTGGGTVANNYGLFVDDQSSVGSTQSYNIYSIGPTSKNFFGGDVFVGGGDIQIGTGSATTTITATSGFLGVASSAPGTIFGVKGDSDFAGSLTVADNLKASYLIATSTTATSTIGYGLNVDSGTFVVDANGNGVLIATSTLPSTNNVVMAAGTGSASSTVFISGGASVGSALIIKSSNGNGCILISGNSADGDADGTIPLTGKLISCPK